MMPLLCKWDLYVIFGGIVNEQAKGNAILQASLERRKQALHVSISIVVSVANANIFLVSFRS
jgi:hypothetical protein